MTYYVLKSLKMNSYISGVSFGGVTSLRIAPILKVEHITTERDFLEGFAALWNKKAVNKIEVVEVDLSEVEEV